MKILVIGNGGREHAIIWKLKQSPKVSEIYCTIGNAGINQIAQPVHIKPDDISGLLAFAKSHSIDFTVVGTELPLSLGIVDEFQRNRLKIFGPAQSAARLETSKSFAKEFMKRNNIPTADFRTFESDSNGILRQFLKSASYPLVIKADGLAAGKGVIVCEDEAAANQTVDQIFGKKIFGSAGDTVVIEEFLRGSEASVFAITDGKEYVLLPPAQDHKRVLDGERGKNTGGMGSFAPANKLITNDVLKRIERSIVEPTLNAMKAEGNEYRGCLYCGLMIDPDGNPFVVEFNARFGDPESQVVLPLIKSDFLDLLLAASDCSIKNYKLETYQAFYCSVVLASRGYPDSYETGKVISGLDKVSQDCIIFHAGTKLENSNIITSGGRVLNIVGKSNNSLKEAIDNAYKNIDKINFQNKYYRTDIGLRGL
jgi:phosphoribosylamine--glycine ligase